MDTYREKTLSNEAYAYKKYEYEHLGRWYIKSISYKRLLSWNKIFYKMKKLLAKLCSLWQVYFVLTILFSLTLAFDVAVLYENDAFSVLVPSTKKRYSSFLKKVFIFQTICFKVLKTFKISSYCLIKTCSSLKRRAILKIPSTVL